MRRLAIVCTLLATGTCWAADPKEEVNKETERLQGTWKVLKSVVDGKADPDEEIKKMRTVVNGDRLRADMGEVRGETMLFRIDPSKKPATIDVTTKEGEVVQGIYELEKDTLKLCSGKQKRPGEFKSDKGTALMILERVKK